MKNPIFRELKKASPVVVFALALCICGSASAVTSTIQIDLHAEAHATRRYLSFGEVADVQGDAPEMVVMVQKIPLGASPAAGSIQTLDRPRLEKWLRSHLAGRLVPFKWTGAEQVTVISDVKKLNGADIGKVAYEALAGWMKDRTTRSEVSQLSRNTDLVVPIGVTTLVARAIPDGTAPSRHMLIWVDIFSDGDFVRTVPVSFSTHAYRQGYIAGADLAPSSSPNRSELEKAEVDVTDDRFSTAIAADDATVAWRVKTLVPKGKAILATQIQPAPAVARGDWATLKSSTGALTLESKVEVLQDGFLGQNVRVKSPSASSSVLGRVTGIGQLEIPQ